MDVGKATTESVRNPLSTHLGTLDFGAQVGPRRPVLEVGKEDNSRSERSLVLFRQI